MLGPSPKDGTLQNNHQNVQVKSRRIVNEKDSNYTRYHNITLCHQNVNTSFEFVMHKMLNKSCEARWSYTNKYNNLN